MSARVYRVERDGAGRVTEHTPQKRSATTGAGVTPRRGNKRRKTHGGGRDAIRTTAARHAGRAAAAGRAFGRLLELVAVLRLLPRPVLLIMTALFLERIYVRRRGRAEVRTEIERGASPPSRQRTGGPADRQTDRHTDKRTNKQTNKQTCMLLIVRRIGSSSSSAATAHSAPPRAAPRVNPTERPRPSIAERFAARSRGPTIHACMHACIHYI